MVKETLKNNKGLIGTGLSILAAGAVAVVTYWNTASVKHEQYEQKFIQHDQKFSHMEKQDAAIRYQLEKIDKRTEDMIRMLINLNR